MTKNYEIEVISCPDCGALVETDTSGGAVCKCGSLVWTNSRQTDMMTEKEHAADLERRLKTAKVENSVKSAKDADSENIRKCHSKENSIDEDGDESCSRESDNEICDISSDPIDENTFRHVVAAFSRLREACHKRTLDEDEMFDEILKLCASYVVRENESRRGRSSVPCSEKIYLICKKVQLGVPGREFVKRYNRVHFNVVNAFLGEPEAESVLIRAYRVSRCIFYGQCINEGVIFEKDRAVEIAPRLFSKSMLARKNEYICHMIVGSIYDIIAKFFSYESEGVVDLERSNGDTSDVSVEWSLQDIQAVGCRPNGNTKLRKILMIYYNDKPLAQVNTVGEVCFVDKIKGTEPEKYISLGIIRDIVSEAEFFAKMHEKQQVMN